MPPSPLSDTKAKARASYTDTLPSDLLSSDATAVATYAIDVLNTSNRSAGLSNQVQVPLVKTLPPPADFHAEVTPQGVQLSWACAPPPQQQAGVAHWLRIYRRSEGNQEERKIGELNLASCQATLTDQNLEWEQTYYYKAGTVTTVSAPGQPEVEIEGEETAELKVLTKDTFAPSVPSGLQAVFSGTEQQPFVDLTWSPGTESDIAGYNIYRHQQDGEAERLNPEPVPTPTYRDENVRPGKQYFYSVSALDLRGNESGKSEEASERVPQEALSN
jgi:hypothetical protein